jgi:hypothetical protein
LQARLRPRMSSVDAPGPRHQTGSLARDGRETEGERHAHSDPEWRNQQERDDHLGRERRREQCRLQQRKGQEISRSERRDRRRGGSENCPVERQAALPSGTGRPVITRALI